ncbi:RNA polymerase I subunit A12.2 [Basidiobolus meristosporus CBS 931.73]|uniref:DNA-directed RNA polymerase subunit n=1 Tax=Basidiobolus meristosporus CBS 931.73 TaxID=1314790 RepID=A0A1Y1WTR0_9FUNG|nr:RNA polymerase I subunit A12.2 [Basidiobolus meristosporus CBS 931.73]ORY05112.1 RNA polymerase I subunit A12.2 [Basidiobolus meristosporus CBS 931.73]|eukprot:ORX76929.1 RNA polymerase I subunit A12.2 [Basidiobolus meristosporus CBS 931.73]
MTNPLEQLANTNTCGSLIFCKECGNLLDMLGDNDIIVCGMCGLTQKTDAFGDFEVITRSSEHAFPSALKNKRSLVQQQPKKREAAATIKEKCPKCGAPEMSFHTMQLRSADEGQTVFYNCTKCGYKYSINS